MYIIQSLMQDKHVIIDLEWSLQMKLEHVEHLIFDFLSSFIGQKLRRPQFEEGFAVAKLSSFRRFLDSL